MWCVLVSPPCELFHCLVTTERAIYLYIHEVGALIFAKTRTIEFPATRSQYLYVYARVYIWFTLVSQLAELLYTCSSRGRVQEYTRWLGSNKCQRDLLINRALIRYTLAEFVRVLYVSVLFFFSFFASCMLNENERSHACASQAIVSRLFMYIYIHTYILWALQQIFCFFLRARTSVLLSPPAVTRYNTFILTRYERR